MSRLFQQRGIWYLDVQINQKRIRKSLNTSHRPTATKVAKEVEPEIIKSVLVGKRPKWFHHSSKEVLVPLFLKAKHSWSPATLTIYKQKLAYYIKNGLPDNPTSRSMVIRCVNRMNRWAYDNKLVPELKKLEGGSRWEHRMRTFNDDEMNLILNDVKPFKYQLFVRFAYYTGARRGEICYLTEDNIREEYVSGKSGMRRIKLNKQAKDILNIVDELWQYRPTYVTQAFKKNLNRLGINNGRFHDLRRTFGYNLIKQGMPIYQLSKLLGHSSVTTTEKHYAPLLATDVGEYIL